MTDNIITIRPDHPDQWESLLRLFDEMGSTVERAEDDTYANVSSTDGLGWVTFVIDPPIVRDWMADGYWAADADAIADRLRQE